MIKAKACWHLDWKRKHMIDEQLLTSSHFSFHLLRLHQKVSWVFGAGRKGSCHFQGHLSEPSCFASRTALRLAVSLFQAMKAQVWANAITYHSLMAVCTQWGQWQRALRLFEEMLAPWPGWRAGQRFELEHFTPRSLNKKKKQQQKGSMPT